jgi:hypothetical protein
MPKYGLGYYDVALVETGVCPGQGASVEAWFAPEGPGGYSMRDPGELRVRKAEHGDIYAVSGAVGAAEYRDDGSDRRQFVAAFRRERRPQIAFASTYALKWLGVDFVALLVLAAGIQSAARRRCLARKVLDPDEFVEGVRLGTQELRVGATVVSTERSLRGPPGPVLVRVASARAGDYRSAPKCRHPT